MRYNIKARFVDIEGGAIDDNVHYGNGDRALAVWHAECYGRPETLSVNLEQLGLRPPEGHVYVKDVSEHEGLPDALVKAGIAEKVREVEFGDYDSKAWLMRVIAWEA